MKSNHHANGTGAHYVAVYASAVFSGAYATKLGLSPVYPAMVGGFVWICLLALSGKLLLSYRFWYVLIGTCGSLAAFAVYQNNAGSLIQNFINFMLGPVGFLVVAGAGKKLSIWQLQKISRAFVFVTIAFGVIECVYRLTHPDFTFLEGAEERNVDLEEVAFYAYKFSSLMYLDSNFVGLQLAVVFAFCLALRRHEIYLGRIVFLLLGGLILLTLSRASILATFAALIVYMYPKLHRWLRILGVMCFVILIQVVYFYIQADGSFLTKLDLLTQFAVYLESASMTAVMLGVGIGNAARVLGMGAHNLLVTYGVELGLILSLVVFAFWAGVCYAARGAVLLVVVWLVNGFSLTSFAMPYMYCAAALLWCISKNNSGRSSDSVLKE